MAAENIACIVVAVIALLIGVSSAWAITVPEGTIELAGVKVAVQAPTDLTIESYSLIYDGTGDNVDKVGQCRSCK